LIRGKKGCKLRIEEHLREGQGRFEGSFFEFFLVFSDAVVDYWNAR